MSKGLKALEELKKQSETHRWLEQQFEKEWLDIIEKELKALEIIKEKGIDVIELEYAKKAKTYNEHTKMRYSKDYTEEEFKLIKEIFEVKK